MQLPTAGQLLLQTPAHDHAPVVGLWSQLPPAMLPPNDFGPHCPRLDFHRDCAFRICFRHRSWSPLGSALAGTRYPPYCSSHRQIVLTIVAQHRCCARGGLRWRPTNLLAHDHSPVVGLWLLLLYFPAAPGISPSLRATTPPPSETSDDGGVQHPSMLHRRWAAIDAHRTLLVPRVRGRSSTSSSCTKPCSSIILAHEAASEPTYCPLECS